METVSSAPHGVSRGKSIRGWDVCFQVLLEFRDSFSVSKKSGFQTLSDFVLKKKKISFEAERGA